MSITKEIAQQSSLQLLSLSQKVAEAIENPQNLVGQLNQISTSGKSELLSRYRQETGKVNDIRRQVAEIISQRNITYEELNTIIDSAKRANPNAFKTMYQTWYNILYVFILKDYKAETTESLENLSSYIIQQSGLEGKLKYSFFDFTGERQRGSERAWIAIYNSSHPKQSTAKQLFIQIENGECFYSLFDWSDNKKHIAPVRVNISNFEVDNIVSHFKPHLGTVLSDLYSDSSIVTIQLEKGQRIYKVSMGPDHFSEEDFDALIRDKKIVVHQDTKPLASSYTSQGDFFVSEMQIGDYFYVSRGNTRIELIGKITSEAVPSTNEGWADDGWLERNFEVIKTAVNKKPYSGIQKWWTPNFNSTCYVINNNDLNLANAVLFKPHFNLTFSIATTTEEIQEPFAVLPNKYDMQLNTIFYGPPGTGKTYHLQGLIKQESLAGLVNTSLQDKESFVKNYKWWQIVAMALYKMPEQSATVPELLEHPLVKAKFATGNIQNPSQRIWGTLQHHTVKDCPNVHRERRYGDLIFYKEANSIWRFDDVEKFKSDFEELLQELEKVHLGTSVSETNRYMFTTCHQSLSYEDFIEGIKPRLFQEDIADEDEAGNIGYTIRKGYFYEACNKAAQLAGFDSLLHCLSLSAADRRHGFENAVNEGRFFYLFLDEINRCNVSAVFGELITLIEGDKRLGAENEIADVLLPYSQDLFGVPLNLRIVGTMNTADRSVEALDTALRRRFVFKAMEPQPELLNEKVVGEIALNTLLTAINERIGYLLDNDHKIGHSYFLKVNTQSELKEVFNNAIIPLLKEYFYNDYEKIQLVLGKGFVTATQQPPQFAGKLTADLDKTTYSFVNLESISDDDFIKALKITVNEQP